MGIQFQRKKTWYSIYKNVVDAIVEEQSVKSVWFGGVCNNLPINIVMLRTM